MSYDLRICKDSGYSTFANLVSLKEFIAKIPNIIPNGNGFSLDDPSTDRWMEIDLEVVDNEGNNIEEDDQEYEKINCINLCIPYSRLKRNSLEQDYLQVARAIAKFVDWPLTDLQTNQVY